MFFPSNHKYDCLFTDKLVWKVLNVHLCFLPNHSSTHIILALGTIILINKLSIMSLPNMHRFISFYMSFHKEFTVLTNLSFWSKFFVSLCKNVPFFPSNTLATVIGPLLWPFVPSWQNIVSFLRSSSLLFPISAFPRKSIILSVSIPTYKQITHKFISLV